MPDIREMDKQNVACIHDGILAVKTKVTSFSGEWMGLEIIKLSESISERLRLSLICGSEVLNKIMSASTMRK